MKSLIAQQLAVALAYSDGKAAPQVVAKAAVCWPRRSSSVPGMPASMCPNRPNWFRLLMQVDLDQHIPPSYICGG